MVISDHISVITFTTYIGIAITMETTRSISIKTRLDTTVQITGGEHARFCVEVFYALYINFHSFIHQRQ